MANIKSFSDFNDKDEDSDGGDFNDYYAGGEKRCDAGCCLSRGRHLLPWPEGLLTPCNPLRIP